MFARSFCRSAAAPLRQGARAYASQAKASGASTVYYGAGAAAAAAGGAYWYSTQSSASVAAAIKLDEPSQEKKAFNGEFISLKLSEVEILSHDTKRLRFHLPEDDMTSGLPVTSAVITKYKGPEMEKAVIRPYTPTSDVDEKGFVEFVIKKYPDGPMSTHIHDLTPGQRLDIKGPIPKYPWEANKHEKVVMIAGGTGITPMFQLVRQIMKDPEDKTQVTLIYGSKTEDDILLKKELAEYENTYPRAFRAFYLLDTPPKEWSGGSGHIDKELLKTVLPEPQTKNLKIFVCGPPGLYKAISGGKKSPQDQGELDGLLKELGYSKDQVFKF